MEQAFWDRLVQMRCQHIQYRTKITQETRKVAHLIFQVPQGGIPEVGHSPFSFTQEGFAHRNPNKSVHEKHSDTRNQEDKQGTIKGQENE